MFSKKPEPPLPAEPQRPLVTSASSAMTSGRPVGSGGATISVIGPDVTIKGDVEASADLQIDGTVNGDIVCTALVQGSSGRIVGSITADGARLAGTLEGTITVRELVVLKTARIDGDVHYETLTIEQGATVNGRFAPAPRAAPAKTVEKSFEKPHEKSEPVVRDILELDDKTLKLAR
jgi:cytoskeletal protein CcmA (bactofilin family)